MRATGADLPAAVAFWILFYAWAGSELLIGWRHRLPAGAVQRDRGSRVAVIASVWASMAVGVVCAFLFPGATIGAGRTAVFSAGLLLMLLGIVLRWYAISVLGSSFTVTVGTRAEQRVVDRGPYHLVRHPSYTGSLLTILGFLLCCSNVVSLAALLLALAGFAYRIHVEEQALANDLGPAYRAYMHRTKRLLPFLL